MPRKRQFRELQVGRQGARVPKLALPPTPCVAMNCCSHIYNMSRLEGNLRSFLALKLRCFAVHWAVVSHCGFLEPFLWPGSFPHFTCLCFALLCSLSFSSFAFSLCFPDPSFTLSPHHKLGIGKFPLGYV